MKCTGCGNALTERPGARSQIVADIVAGGDPFARTLKQLRPPGPYVRITDLPKVLQLKSAYEEIYRFDAPDRTGEV
jgi:hypothetical protein